MERDGVKVDREVLKRLSAEFNIQIAALEETDLRRGGLQVHDRQPAAARRHPVQPDGPVRAGARASPASIRPTSERARAAGSATACRSPGWCSTGASSPSSSRPIPTRCRSRSTATPAASTPAISLSGAQTGRLASTDPNLHEHPDPHRDRPADPRRLRRRAGLRDDVRRLQPDRTSPRRPYLRRAAAARSLRGGRGHPQPHRAGTVRRGQSRHARAARRRSTSRSSTASRAGASPSGWRSRRTRRRR